MPFFGTPPARLCAVLLLCAMGIIPAHAQNAETRPQRTRMVDAPLASPPRAPFAFPENTLLTPDVLEQPLTRYYIKQYSTAGGTAWLNAVMKRGEMYLSFIREEIARRNLPPELVYLPVIESGYLGSAKSRSGAVGLWQFMLNSIAPFDMKVNGTVDERRDFQKATRGALQKLDENYRFFGNWPLALAAYNAGLGGVNRVVKKTGSSDYWRLCEQKELRAETIHYVPKLAAAAWILSQPRRFGIDSWPRPIEWRTLMVGKQVSLDLLAGAAGIDRALLRQANMELSHGFTPSDSAYRLKVPAREAARVAETLARDDLTLLTVYRYVIQYGDTLSVLARHYDVPQRLIEQHNPGIANRYLKIGETIVIPALKEIAPYAGKSKEAGADFGAASFGGNHLVKKGETLWSLAIAYSVDPEALARANGMELNQILSEGKNLKVPIIE